MFTHWLLSARLGRSLKYFGYDGTGRQVRDLLHVADAVDLVEQQLLDPERWSGRTFNAGGGRANSLSLCELTAAVEEITGQSLEVGRFRHARDGCALVRDRQRRDHRVLRLGTSAERGRYAERHLPLDCRS